MSDWVRICDANAPLSVRLDAIRKHVEQQHLARIRDMLEGEVFGIRHLTPAEIDKLMAKAAGAIAPLVETDTLALIGAARLN